MSNPNALAVTQHGNGQAAVHDLIDDRYRLVRLLDAGALAQTWAARDTRLNRDVAVELTYIAGATSPTTADLQQDLSTRYGDLPAVYDAGSHSVAGGACTFVVTPLRGPVHEASMSNVPSGDAADDDADGFVLAAVGDWSAVVTIDRRRKGRGAHAAATVSVSTRLIARLRRAGDLGSDSLSQSIPSLATSTP